MRLKREDFLVKLQAVLPGLRKGESADQSTSFVFQDGQVMTYNEHLACIADIPALDRKFEGATLAKPLLEIIQALKHDEIDITEAENKLVITGPRTRDWVPLDHEVSLNINDVEMPSKWKALPGTFNEAIELTTPCVGTDDRKFALVCINFTPKYIEATDNWQVCRYSIKLGIDQPFLVRASSIKALINFGMTEFSESEKWAHFRNPSGVSISCRLHREEKYPDYTDFMNVKGDPITFSKTMLDAIKCGEVFAKMTSDGAQLTIDLIPGKLRISGSSDYGGHSQVCDLPNYKGEGKCFLIAPKLLTEIINRGNDCELSEKSLRASGANWVYSTCIGKAEEEE